ncbi:MAG: Carbohydrate binding family 6 [Firmicutes bacterium]|nr:Carbohydrate binding family 6 [Bacillota bacterium]
MATVGKQLTAPETGWKRYDDTDQNISYVGSWKETTPNSDVGAAYSGSYMYNNTIGNCVRFKFTGAIIRIIHYCWSNNSSNIEVNIDGDVSTYSASYTNKNQVLVFEKSNLFDGEHYIVLTNKTSAYQTFDAVDIDESGVLKPFIAIPTNLTAVAGDSQVTLSWTAVDGATSYNVKRSTTSGGTYTTIASNVTGTSYVDTSVTNGTTYYYVVTAVNADGESNNSNEASAKPVDSGKVLLVITMSDEVQKEYELSKAELDVFISWYNNRSAGNGLPYYIFNKSFNLGPFDSREDYIVFNKIENFEVMKFSK